MAGLKMRVFRYSVFRCSHARRAVRTASVSRIVTLSTALICAGSIVVFPYKGLAVPILEPGTPSLQANEVKWNSPPASPIPGVEHGVLHSPSMDLDVGYNVYLPPGYAESTRKYPVVYFLHGAGGTESSDAGGFSGLVRKEMDAKRIPPVVCVFPNGGMSGYRDNPDRKIMGETLIIKELIPLIDSKYRTIASREGRTICGFSMGGGGSIRLALQHPDLFSAAASWAAALNSRGSTVSPADLAKQNVDKIRGKVRFLLVVGDKDPTFPSHAPFIEALKDLKLSHDYQVLPGVEHNLGAYYEQTGAKLVKFVTAGFAESLAPKGP
jgi:enterochelin esterase-like enzyme